MARIAGNNITNEQFQLWETWMWDRPVDEQVLLHSEALRPGVALGLVLGSPWFGQRLAWFILVTLQLRELQHLLLLHTTVVPGLLPHPWCINYQCVLKTFEETSQNTFTAFDLYPRMWPICTSLVYFEHRCTPLQISLIGYLAPCFICGAEKIAAQLKHKPTLIMLSNELHFCFQLARLFSLFLQLH